MLEMMGVTLLSRQHSTVKIRSEFSEYCQLVSSHPRPQGASDIESKAQNEICVTEPERRLRTDEQTISSRWGQTLQSCF